MPINQSILIDKSRLYDAYFSESVGRSRIASTYKTAFLCHSHNDHALVHGLLRYFEELKVSLYVDWKDHSMPNTPIIETASKIQKKIRENDVFLFLATANSRASRWCPWEIGYADSSKKKIYIIPTEDRNDNYGNEYLSLYSRIDIGVNEKTSERSLAIFNTDGNGSWLSESIL